MCDLKCHKLSWAILLKREPLCTCPVWNPGILGGASHACELQWRCSQWPCLQWSFFYFDYTLWVFLKSCKSYALLKNASFPSNLGHKREKNRKSYCWNRDPHTSVFKSCNLCRFVFRRFPLWRIWQQKKAVHFDPRLKVLWLEIVRGLHVSI